MEKEIEKIEKEWKIGEVERKKRYMRNEIEKEEKEIEVVGMKEIIRK